MRSLTSQVVAGGFLIWTVSCSSAEQGETAVADTTDLMAAQAVDSVAQRAQELGVEVVGQGVISTSGNQTFPAEDPTDGSLWYSVYDDDFAGQTIMVAQQTNSGWAPPAVASFSGTHGDRAPRFSPDGRYLYFTSNRPRTTDGTSDDMNIWRVARSNGTWSEPEPLGDPVNSDGQDIHASVTNSAIWVASNRAGTMGRSDIYRVGLGNNMLGDAEHLPAPLNDANSQPDIWVSPDETWMILAITDHPDGFGGDDLFISRVEDGSWTAPVNLGAGINSPEYEYGPTMSRDGQYILFTSHRAGSANVYRVPVSSVSSDAS